MKEVAWEKEFQKLGAELVRADLAKGGSTHIGGGPAKREWFIARLKKHDDEVASTQKGQATFQNRLAIAALVISILSLVVAINALCNGSY